MTISATITFTIFAITYLGLAIGRYPFLRIDRAGIALVGAALMLALGQIDLKHAAYSVDYETLVLLFGMMILVGYLRISGFFSLVIQNISNRSLSPRALLGVIVGLSGLLSAFLVNDVVCVALTPLVIDLCKRLKKPAIPYLVALATASNIGSVATITGNPQNMIVGSLSGISYLRFAAKLSPVAIVGLFIDFGVIAFIYRKAMNEKVESENGESERVRVHLPLLVKSVSVTLIAILLFFLGKSVAVVALVAAAVLLLDRVRPEKVYRSVDWPLLVMFSGLFVVIHVFELNVVHSWGLEKWQALLNSPVVLMSGLSVVLSNLVSNVPSVLLFKPLMAVVPEKEQAWLALSMSSTLAGNLTILGSVANLIVVESARRSGARLSFVEYLKVGVPVTLLTTLGGVLWLALVRY